MITNDNLEAGQYWIRIGDLPAEVGFWDPEAGGWRLQGVAEIFIPLAEHELQVLSGPIAPP